MSVVQEFKKFAFKGNVIDLAVGVIIDAAFGKIVTSVVEDLVMPLIAALIGDIDFSNMLVFMGDPKKLEAAMEAAKVTEPTLKMAKEAGPTLAYGNFITIAINFIIVAIAIFAVVKAINTAKAKFEKEDACPVPEEPKGPTQEELLAEIRDLLKKKNA